MWLWYNTHRQLKRRIYFILNSFREFRQWSLGPSHNKQDIMEVEIYCRANSPGGQEAEKGEEPGQHGSQGHSTSDLPPFSKGPVFYFSSLLNKVMVVEFHQGIRLLVSLELSVSDPLWRLSHRYQKCAVIVFLVFLNLTKLTIIIDHHTRLCLRQPYWMWWGEVSQASNKNSNCNFIFSVFKSFSTFRWRKILSLQIDSIKICFINQFFISSLTC